MNNLINNPINKQNTNSLPIVVLISGNGSNLQAIIDRSNLDLNIKICAVISNVEGAYGLQRAKKANIPTHVIPHQDFNSREDFELKLRETIDQYNPQLIVLAGFMRFLESATVKHYLGKMINIHPSLLPKYRGLHTHRRVVEAGDTMHGVSVHFVTDDLDGGPVISQATCSVAPNDTEESLKQKVQELEHQLYPHVINMFAEDRVKLRDDQVELDGKLLMPAQQIVSF